MKRISLLLRIRLMFAGVLAALAAIVGISMWWLSRGSVEQQVEKDVTLAAEYLRSYVGQEGANLNLRTKQLAQSPALVGTMGTKDKATIAENLPKFQASSGIDGLSLHDTTGEAIFRSGMVPAKPTRFSQKRLQIIGQTKDSDRSNSFSSYQGGFLITSTAPIKVGPVNQIGALTGFTFVGKNDTSRLSQSLGIELAFIYGAGVVSSSIPTPDALPNDGAFHVQDLNGEAYGMKYVVISETGWDGQVGIMVMRSVSDATAVYRRLTTLFLLLLGGAMVLAMILSAHLAKAITKPLDTVVKAATQLEAGQWPERLEVTARDELGLLQNVFNSMTESLQASEQRLFALIDADPLTELANHRSFREDLDMEVARCREVGGTVSLLLIDIDHFKEFNANRGHSEGDEALKQVARAIESTTPEYARRARYGGEEFAVLLPNCELASAESFAEAIRHATSSRVYGITVSIGVAQFGPSTSKSEGLTMAAEIAVNRAKQLGRDRVCRFDDVPGADANADPYQLHKFMQDASLATIQALAAAVDAKDPYTRGHSQRVAQYAAELARYVGRKEAEIELIYRTGTLHDVGKIGVPDSILKKPERLSDDERAIMETHPVLGEVIVRKVPQLEETLPGVRHHHERWDGRGYPDGLSAEQIPYMARVLAVADTYDAMTSDRPYRKGLAVDFALGEIAKGAGTQFDPLLADAFVEMMRGEELAAAA